MQNKINLKHLYNNFQNYYYFESFSIVNVDGIVKSEKILTPFIKFKEQLYLKYNINDFYNDEHSKLEYHCYLGYFDRIPNIESMNVNIFPKYYKLVNFSDIGEHYIRWTKYNSIFKSNNIRIDVKLYVDIHDNIINKSNHDKDINIRNIRKFKKMMKLKSINT